MAMPAKVAINGCGRIGRLALRLAFERPEAFEIVHLNDLGAAASTAYLSQFDSVHGAHSSLARTLSRANG